MRKFWSNNRENCYLVDHTLQLWNHSIEKSHKNVNTIDLTIIDKNLHNNKRKRKTAEALWIKVLRLTLNTQEKSVELKISIDYAGHFE